MLPTEKSRVSKSKVANRQLNSVRNGEPKTTNGRNPKNTYGKSFNGQTMKMQGMTNGKRTITSSRTDAARDRKANYTRYQNSKNK